MLWRRLPELLSFVQSVRLVTRRDGLDSQRLRRRRGLQLDELALGLEVVVVRTVCSPDAISLAWSTPSPSDSR